MIQVLVNILIFVKDKFSTIDKMKIRTYIKNLRHRSLHIYVKNDVLKFKVYKCFSQSDIHVIRNSGWKAFFISRKSNITIYQGIFMKIVSIDGTHNILFINQYILTLLSILKLVTA